jgi:hypothetical protein
MRVLFKFLNYRVGFRLVLLSTTDVGTKQSSYYNQSRTHLSLNKDSPVRRPIHAVGYIEAKPILGGIHHCYVRI